MIEINLLKTKTVGGQSAVSSIASGDSSGEMIGLILRGLLLLCIPVGLYFYEGSIVNEKTAILAEKQTLLNNVSGQVAKYGAAEQVVKQLHEEKAKLAGQIDIIKKISGKRSKKLKFLKTIQNTIPETVWIKKVEFKDENVDIIGRSTNTDSMQEFVRTLNSSGVAKEVINEGFNKVKIGQVEIYEFKLHVVSL